MRTAPTYASPEELDQGLPHVLESPQDEGHLRMIVVRPQENERRSLESATLTPDSGIEGDCWALGAEHGSPSTRPDPQSQVSLMNGRILQLIAGGEDAMALAGDNLIMDLDLSEANLPAGSRLRIGTEVVLELTAQPHTGCGKFSRRFGEQARRFVNGPRGKRLNLRGRYGRILQGGTVRRGDVIMKVAKDPA